MTTDILLCLALLIGVIIMNRDMFHADSSRERQD